MWWIRKQDQRQYEYLMEQDGQTPSIIQEKDDLVQVNFTAHVLNEWQMMGNWIG